MSSGYLKKKEDGTYGANKTTTTTPTTTGNNVAKATSGGTLADMGVYKSVRPASAMLSEDERYKQDFQISQGLLDSINNGTLKDNQYASYFKDGYGWNLDGSFWYDDGSGVTNLAPDGSLRAKYDKSGTYVDGDKAYDNRQPTISYADSPAVQAAEQQISAAQSKGDKLSSIIDDYLGREKFSYDPEADTLFQQNLANAMNMGQMAMQDTMGQAAGLTGGYGSTYATSAANQAYNSMIENAYDNVADYYNMALSQYNLEDNRLLNAYNILNEQDTKDWQKYVDDRNFNYQKEQDSKDWEWKASEAQREQGNIDRQFEESVRQFDAGVEQWEKSFEYQQLRDSIADSQWQTQFDEAVREWKKEMRFKVKQGKISQEQWQAEFDEKVREWEKEYGLANAKFAEDKRQSDRNYELALSKQEASEAASAEKSQYTSTQLASVKKDALAAYDSGGEAGLKDFIADTDDLKTMTDDDIAAVYDYARRNGLYDKYVADYLSMYDKRDNGYYFNGKPISIFQVFDEFNTYMTKNNVPNDVRDKARTLLSKTLKGE